MELMPLVRSVDENEIETEEFACVVSVKNAAELPPVTGFTVRVVIPCHTDPKFKSRDLMRVGAPITCISTSVVAKSNCAFVRPSE